MSNPIKTLERMLAENGFREISSDAEHRTLHSAKLDGRVIILSRTRSDDRWAKAAIADLTHVLTAAPRALIVAKAEFAAAEATRVGLRAQAKPTQGIRTNLVKTKGTGFIYYDPDDELSSEEKAEKAQQRAQDQLAQEMQRQQRRADEAEARRILELWMPILGVIKELRVTTLTPFALKFLQADKVRFWGVTILSDELHFEKSADGGVTRRNGCWRPDHSGYCERQTQSQRETCIGVGWSPDETIVDEVRMPDGTVNYGVHQFRDHQTIEFSREPQRGMEWTEMIVYSDGRMSCAKQVQSDGRISYGVEYQADNAYATVERDELNGVIRRNGRTTDHGRTWQWENEPAPKRAPSVAETLKKTLVLGEIAATNLELSPQLLARIIR